MARRNKRKKRKKWARELVNGIKEDSSCRFCGEEDPSELTFHHVRGIKRACVSNAVHSGWPPTALVKEIDKCDILCQRCHNLLHYYVDKDLKRQARERQHNKRNGNGNGKKK